jgi:hypothetical protein
MNITTNHQPRRLLFACEFSGAERTKLRQQFDWMSDEDFDSDCSFFRYKGDYYNLADFMRIEFSAKESALQGWHAYSSDSYFSGVLIKLCGEDVIVGHYCS